MSKKRKDKKSKKAKKVHFVPKGYASVTPYLVVHDAKAALAFYKKAFGAKEFVRIEAGGKVAHAEVRIGDSVVMLADEHLEMGAKSARTVGGSPLSLMIYLKGVDKVVARAIKLGAMLTRPVVDQFYGDRSGMVQDPFGHQWTLATHTEEVSPKEMKKRMKALGGG